jgi:glycosyltransferase involved in cell wall biosynthesis
MFTDHLTALRRHCDLRAASALCAEIRDTLHRIPADFGGGCSLSKACLIAELIRRYGLQVTVDIGVYRGRSLVPQALAHRRFTGGVAYGVDPWSASEAQEFDNPRLKEKIDQWANKTDFQAIYEEVTTLVNTLQIERHCTLLRRTSAAALSFFQENGVSFDLIHIDGNHDTEIVVNDVRSYLPRLKPRGFIILDDISWESVRPAYDELATLLPQVFEHCDYRNDYAVFWNASSRLGAWSRRSVLRCMTLGGKLAIKESRSELLTRLGRKYSQARTIAVNSVEDTAVVVGNHFPASRPKDKLIILDARFPRLSSAFKIAEYNAYLERFKNSEVQTLPVVGENGDFSAMLNVYGQRYPQFKNKVLKFNPKRNLAANLLYTIFLGNASRFIEVAERHNIPFIFTLYPGGAFKLDQAQSDAMLARVCSSPNLEKVIVTQKISHEYLIEKKFCEPDKIEFIYGLVVASDHLADQVAKKYYSEHKSTFDICFVAYKYADLDKGYSVFVNVAKSLAKTYKDMFFHVIGTFDASDADISDIQSRVKFYGTQHTEFFPEFYSHMDIILSPNAPFVLGPGTFDGFPTGSCVEAGLCGVAVFCTDILSQNVVFKEGEEIVIIPRDVEEICKIVGEYYDNYDALCRLSKKGQEAFKRVFGLEAQLRPRLRILAEGMKTDVAR